MPQKFTIRIAESGDHITVAGLQGIVDAALGVEIAAALIEADRSLRCRRYLVDFRGGPTAGSDAERYDFAYRQLDLLDAPRDTRVALLPDPSDESLGFFETVMVNAGYCLRLFDDEQAAVAWLLSEGDSAGRCSNSPRRDAS